MRKEQNRGETRVGWGVHQSWVGSSSSGGSSAANILSCFQPQSAFPGTLRLEPANLLALVQVDPFGQAETSFQEREQTFPYLEETLET